jgi:ketosteroid isomerase-like protein
MSQKNVEIVKAIYEAWADNRSAAPFIDKELEYVNPPYAVEPGTRHGRHHLRKVREIFPDVRFLLERYIDAGDDVVVIAKMLGRGSSSGVDTETRQGYVWTVAGGKAVRLRWFNDPAEALEAAGLSERDAKSDSS